MSWFRRLLKRLKVSDRGTATIEGAIIMPFLVLLFAGIADFGRVLWHYQTVNTGVRDATRYLSRRTLGDPVACTLAGGADTEAQNLATTGNIGGGTLRLSYFTTTTATAEPIPGGPARYPCRVRVQATVTIPVLMLDFIGIGPITFTLEDMARYYGD